MSYYKKTLLAVAFCAALGLHSADAVTFNELKEPQKKFVKLIEAALEDAIVGLTAIDTYLARCIAQCQQKDVNKIEVCSAEGLLRLTKIYQSSQEKFSDQITREDDKILKAKNVTYESVRNLFSSTSIMFNELHMFVDFNDNKINRQLEDKNVKYFKTLANEIKKLSSILKNAINFGNNDNDWIDFLFGNEQNTKTVTSIPDDSFQWPDESLPSNAEEKNKIENDEDQKNFENESNVSNEGENKKELLRKSLLKKLNELSSGLPEHLRNIKADDNDDETSSDEDNSSINEDNSSIESEEVFENEKEKLRKSLLQKLNELSSGLPTYLRNITAEHKKRDRFINHQPNAMKSEQIIAHLEWLENMRKDLQKVQEEANKKMMEAQKKEANTELQDDEEAERKKVLFEFANIFGKKELSEKIQRIYKEFIDREINPFGMTVEGLLKWLESLKWLQSIDGQRSLYETLSNDQKKQEKIRNIFDACKPSNNQPDNLVSDAYNLMYQALKTYPSDITGCERTFQTFFEFLVMDNHGLNLRGAMCMVIMDAVSRMFSMEIIELNKEKDAAEDKESLYRAFFLQSQEAREEMLKNKNENLLLNEEFQNFLNNDNEIENMDQGFNNNSSSFENEPVILNQDFLDFLKEGDLPQANPGGLFGKDEEWAKLIIPLSPEERRLNKVPEWMNKLLEEIRIMPQKDAKHQGFLEVWELMQK